MIKEFRTLATMLFGSKPENVGEVRLMQMNHFPARGRKYLSWCGHLIYRKDEKDDRRREWITKEYRVRKEKENMRLEKAKQCGSWWKFYFKSLMCKL